MLQSKLIKQRLVTVFLVGLLLLFSPVVKIFDRQELWFGLPVLYLYLFGIWLLLIVAMAWVLREPNE